MDHPNHFDKRVVNIRLDESRASRIAAAIRGLQEFRKRDELSEFVTASPTSRAPP